MASFQAKIGWIRHIKGENKNCCSVPFHSYMTRNRKFQKNSNKIQNIKKYHYGLISSQNWMEKAEKERKLKLSLCFVLTLSVIENSKKIAKKFKKLKNSIMASFQSKIHCRKPRKGNNETYCSDPFLPTRLIIENSKKIATKFVKVINTHMA